jgi:hypothetical protein
MNSKVDASPLPFEIKRADHPPLAAFASVPCCLGCDVSGVEPPREGHQNFK